MSNSALSSAKRRRANNVTNSPLFQTPGSKESEITSDASPARPEVNANRPMSLQQALQLLNSRILQMEKKLEQSKTDSSNVSSSSAPLDVSSIEAIVKKVTETQVFEEFNHRYEVLASEILNLKHIVMKLQSYTLDINKTLVEERIQILSDIPEKQGVSLIEVKDDLNLRHDIEEMVQNSELDLQQSQEIAQVLETSEIKELLVEQMTETNEELPMPQDASNETQERENVEVSIESENVEVSTVEKEAKEE